MIMEKKHERFKRLAVARTEKALDMIDLIGNLSNKSFYDYTEEEIKAIFSQIREVVDENEEKFLKTKGKKKRRFTL